MLFFYSLLFRRGVCREPSGLILKSITLGVGISNLYGRSSATFGGFAQGI
jgi:hypothetical protein